MCWKYRYSSSSRRPHTASAWTAGAGRAIVMEGNQPADAAKAVLVEAK